MCKDIALNTLYSGVMKIIFLKKELAMEKKGTVIVPKLPVFIYTAIL